VTTEKGRLYTAPAGGQKTEAHAMSETEFFYEGSLDRLRFERDAAGAVAAFVRQGFGSAPERFQRTGAIRTVYLSILLTHTVLAAAVPVLAVVTLTRALRGRFDKHRRIARWTFPIWLSVSVTGVVVYVMLYRM
jgi:hypothetical protein